MGYMSKLQEEAEPAPKKEKRNRNPMKKELKRLLKPGG